MTKISTVCLSLHNGNPDEAFNEQGYCLFSQNPKRGTKRTEQIEDKKSEGGKNNDFLEMRGLRNKMHRQDKDISTIRVTSVVDVEEKNVETINYSRL